LHKLVHGQQEIILILRLHLKVYILHLQNNKILIRVGADPDQEIFCRVAADDEPVFKYIAEYLGIEKPAIKFHNQKTGQMLHLHIDNFAARPERDNSI